LPAKNVMTNKSNQDEPKLNSTLTLIGSVSSLLMMIVYGTWFVSNYDKRITILEQSSASAMQRIVEFKEELDSANDAQDKAMTRLQDQIDSKLTRMEDRMEKVLSILGYERKKLS
jgi:uncharacterized coiled-coil protein SlyX